MPNMKYMLRKKIDNREVRRQVDKNSPAHVILLVLFALIIAAGMIFFGWIRWKQREILFRLNQVEAQIAEQEEENKKLRAELERLNAPGRISRIAREELGMIEPAEDDYILVEAGDAASQPEAGK